MNHDLKKGSLDEKLQMATGRNPHLSRCGVLWRGCDSKRRQKNGGEF